MQEFNHEEFVASLEGLSPEEKLTAVADRYQEVLQETRARQRHTGEYLDCLRRAIHETVTPSVAELILRRSARLWKEMEAAREEQEPRGAESDE